MNQVSKESKFLLKLVSDTNMTPEEATCVMEELADADGTRLDVRSASFQTLLINLIGKDKLVEAAKAIKAKREKKDEVTKVEIVNLPQK